MINIDFLTIKAFFLENIDFFIGGRLQKIQQPTRRDFLFTIRNNGETKKLYVNIDPKIYHIAFLNEITEKRRGIKIPQKPPMFCMLLRKYLEGNRISDGCVIKNERIIEFHFEIIDELSQKRMLCLAIELMGKHSNVILYDRESFVILGCAHNVGSDKSRYRELRGGLKYIYPPKNDSIKLSDELIRQFKSLTSEQKSEYLETEIFRPALFDERYTLFSELLVGSKRVSNVNEMLDDYYSAWQEKYLINTEKTKLKNAINSKLKKVINSQEKIKTLLKKRDNGEKYRLYGELIKANIYLKRDYQREIELFDYESNKNIVIALDETKTMSENAQRYFKLYAKSKSTHEKSVEILNGLQVEQEYLEQILYSIESASNISELNEIDSEINPQDKKCQRNEESEILKLNISGFDVYVGKNNKQNDRIVSKLSKEEDYWFHTRLCAGSHVLLKVREKEPDEEIIFECCKLARKYSSASQPSKVGVVYTKRKFVKKPPAAPLGYVIYKNEKEVLV